MLETYTEGRASALAGVRCPVTARGRFLGTMSEACERFGLVMHRCCLMPNDYHLLTQTPRAKSDRDLAAKLQAWRANLSSVKR